MSSIPRLSMQQPTHARTGHPSDRYWRMPRFDLALQTTEIRNLLEAHNYPHNGTTADLQLLLTCIARSQPGYEKCTMPELRRFVKDRRLHPAGTHRRTRKQMVDALRHADSSPRFSPFTSLPRELRDTIYSLYCRDFADEPLALPTNPPLARANKQLREEVLPIFYSECTFSLQLTVAPRWQQGMVRELRMQHDTALFFKPLSAPHLACIQKLDIDFSPPNPHLRPRYRDVGCAFNLRVCVPRDARKAATAVYTSRNFGNSGFGYNPAQIVAESGRALRCPWSGEAMIGSSSLEGLEGEVLRFAVGIQQREGINHLVLDDVYRLRRLIEDFFDRAQQ